MNKTYCRSEPRLMSMDVLNSSPNDILFNGSRVDSYDSIGSSNAADLNLDPKFSEASVDIGDRLYHTCSPQSIPSHIANQEDRYDLEPSSHDPEQEGSEWGQILHQTTLWRGTNPRAQPSLTSDQTSKEPTSQQKLPQANNEDIETILHILKQNWPTILDRKTRIIWDNSLNKYLHGNCKMIKSLLNNDTSAWKEAFDWSSPSQMSIRCRLVARHIKLMKKEKEKGEEKDGSSNSLIGTAWLAGKILMKDKERIRARLSKYWHNASGAAVHSRLMQYAKAYGKIQSPEPLLSQDERLFRVAADHIALGPVGMGLFADGKRQHKMTRHPDAGPFDLLHSYSPQYSVLSAEGLFDRIDVGKAKKRPSAKRYNTGQAWLNEPNYHQIDIVHDLVASHWKKTTCHQTLARQFVRLNEYLQQNQEILQQIRGDNDRVAWETARITAEKIDFMKSPNEYQPSDEYLHRLGL